MAPEYDAPVSFPRQKVLPDWIDFNGHMNVAYYLYAFDRCVDHLYNDLGVGPAFVEETGSSVFTLEAHINYLSEVVEADPLEVTGRLMDHDAKRIHAYFEMHHGTDGRIVAAMEQIGIHVSMETRRPVEFEAGVTARLASMSAAHRGLPAAEYAGRVIGIRRR